MADDSTSIPIPYKNHPENNPYGMLEYDFEALTSHQQRSLDNLKINTIREDHVYLANHPEVRAIVCLLLRAFFNRKPNNVHEFAKEFVKQPHLQKMVAEFLSQYTEKTESERRQDETKSKKCSFPATKSSVTSDSYSGRNTTAYGKKESTVSTILEEIMGCANSLIESSERVNPTDSQT